MNKPLDDDFNYNFTGTLIPVTTGTINLPKEARGGTLAPADVPLIKNALAYYARLDISDAEQRQIANLLHRLGRIG